MYSDTALDFSRKNYSEIMSVVLRYLVVRPAVSALIFAISKYICYRISYPKGEEIPLIFDYVPHILRVHT